MIIKYNANNRKSQLFTLIPISKWILQTGLEVLKPNEYFFEKSKAQVCTVD